MYLLLIIEVVGIILILMLIQRERKRKGSERKRERKQEKRRRKSAIGQYNNTNYIVYHRLNNWKLIKEYICIVYMLVKATDKKGFKFVLLIVKFFVI